MLDPKLFASENECQQWLDANGILAIPHKSYRIGRNGWIAVYFQPTGVFGVVDADRAILLPDW